LGVPPGCATLINTGMASRLAAVANQDSSRWMEREMTTLHGGRTTSLLSLREAERLAARYQVPVGDVLLLGINLYGISSELGTHRARLQVGLDMAPGVPWQVIVPLNAAGSPFILEGDLLELDGEPVGTVERIDADDAVGGYFRDGGRAATLNPNARSRCVGCAFCPNTLEAAADPRLAEERGLKQLLGALSDQHPSGDLAELEEITVSTGCFEREQAALDHLMALRSVLTEAGVTARIGFLTSVIRSAGAFARLAAEVSPFVLRLTAECFTRRDVMLKASKAELTASQMPVLLRGAKDAGLGTSYTYIVGLDDRDTMRRGVAGLVPHITEFPNFQVYQAHNSIMAGFRVPEADGLEFYLRSRVLLEELVGPTGLRPVAWECYRPLWYFEFAGESLVGA
jgi:hypothetical protein